MSTWKRLVINVGFCLSCFGFGVVSGYRLHKAPIDKCTTTPLSADEWQKGYICTIVPLSEDGQAGYITIYSGDGKFTGDSK